MFLYITRIITLNQSRKYSNCQPSKVIELSILRILVHSSVLKILLNCKVREIIVVSFVEFTHEPIESYTAMRKFDIPNRSERCQVCVEIEITP